jgi:hypothetical protein
VRAAGAVARAADAVLLTGHVDHAEPSGGCFMGDRGGRDVSRQGRFENSRENPAGNRILRRTAGASASAMRSCEPGITLLNYSRHDVNVTRALQCHRRRSPRQSRVPRIVGSASWHLTGPEDFCDLWQKSSVTLTVLHRVLSMAHRLTAPPPPSPSPRPLSR